jgi:hypothetical protein
VASDRAEPADSADSRCALAAEPQAVRRWHMLDIRRRYWPKLTDVRSAREVAHRSASLAMIIAGFTAVFAVLALLHIPMIPGVDGWALTDAALWAGLAVGIWRMSRGAAAAGLAAIVAEQLLGPNREVGMAYLIATVLVVLAFVNGLRAASAYHRLLKPKPQAFSPDPLEPR